MQRRADKDFSKFPRGKRPVNRFACHILLSHQNIVQEICPQNIVQEICPKLQLFLLPKFKRGKEVLIF